VITFDVIGKEWEFRDSALEGCSDEQVVKLRSAIRLQFRYQVHPYSVKA